MGNLQNAFAAPGINEDLFKQKRSDQMARDNREKQFLEKYDEVLNTCILNVFRKPTEEFDKAKDHTAVMIIGGEIVKLRLDCLQGEADGIRIFLENEALPMYIWFAPNRELEKISFKTLFGELRRKEQHKLGEITKDFLAGLIYKRFIATGKKLLS